MKLSSTGLALGLASIAVADSDYASAASSDYWGGYDPTDVAPAGCAKPTPFFDCYKVVSKYAHCTDDACNCSSVMIDQSCIKQNCGTDFVFNTVDSTLYCTGTATKGMSIAAEKTPSPARPASTEATATPAPTAAAGQPTTGTGTVSGTAASKPNAGERSMRVSAGGLFAVAAAAVGSLLYRL